MLKREISIFFSALMFFTRIPGPKWIDHSENYLAKSSRYLSLVGIIVGIIGAAVFYGFSFIFPRPLAILLSMISTILVTGAFHEDGLADTCDGFGGGWTKESILKIMKDSRIGTFGVIGLCSALAIKFCCLYYIDTQFIPVVLIAGHALSRAFASTFLYTHEYVRVDDSKAKSAATPMSAFSLVMVMITGLIPLILFFDYRIFILLVPILLVRLYLGNYFNKWIVGMTGDSLGAAQQIFEIVFYLSLLVLWKYI